MPLWIHNHQLQKPMYYSLSFLSTNFLTFLPHIPLYSIAPFLVAPTLYHSAQQYFPKKLANNFDSEVGSSDYVLQAVVAFWVIGARSCQPL